MHSTKYLEHNEKEQSYPTVSKHPDVWHGEGGHPGTCPVDKGVPSTLKGSRSWAPLTGTSFWPWSQSPRPRAATFSLCRVRPDPKTTDLKPFLVTQKWGQRRWEQKPFTTNPFPPLSTHTRYNGIVGDNSMVDLETAPSGKRGTWLCSSDWTCFQVIDAAYCCLSTGPCFPFAALF